MYLKGSIETITLMLVVVNLEVSEVVVTEKAAYKVNQITTSQKNAPPLICLLTMNVSTDIPHGYNWVSIMLAT